MSWASPADYNKQQQQQQQQYETEPEDKTSAHLPLLYIISFSGPRRKTTDLIRTLFMLLYFIITIIKLHE